MPNGDQEGVYDDVRRHVHPKVASSLYAPSSTLALAHRLTRYQANLTSSPEAIDSCPAQVLARNRVATSNRSHLHGYAGRVAHADAIGRKSLVRRRTYLTALRGEGSPRFPPTKRGLRDAHR